MDRYFDISSMLKVTSMAEAEEAFAFRIVPKLIDIWIDASENISTDIVETTAANFSYLFDVGNDRLIAAWGISRGRIGGDRDASRMKRFPLSAGPKYHRGHAIPHRLGGILDINLVPQRGDINIGLFRQLEMSAVANPGALYFTFWMYRGKSQMPSGVDQGVLIVGETPLIKSFHN